MKATQQRGLLLHITLLAVAAGCGAYLWLRDKEPLAKAQSDVVVWPGRPSDVQRIDYDSKTRKVNLLSQKDSIGRWFAGTAENAASSTAPVQIVSVAAGEKVAEQVAPLRAVRDLGNIALDKAADFGLKEPQGTLSVVINGKEHKLAVGDSTPGGNDRYMRDLATGEGYAVKGDFLRDLEAGEASLNEREVHGFKIDPDVESVVIHTGGKERKLLRNGPENRRLWSDSASADKADEMATTWLTKIDRLRPTEYVKDLPKPIEPSNMVVHIEYKGKSGSLGFLDLVKIAAEGAPRSDYYLKTERTRLYAKIYAALGEQVEQDAGSVIK